MKKRSRLGCLGAIGSTRPIFLIPSALCILALSVFLGSTSADAQYTDNYQTNIIDGVYSNWVGNGTYVIGSNSVSDALVIQNGGGQQNGIAYIGYEAGADNNAAVVSGNGSAWYSQDLYVGYSGAGNQMFITNGGTAQSSGGSLGYNSGSSNNTVVVSGPGSTWRSLDINIGVSGSGNRLIISNGGSVNGLDGRLGYNSSSSDNAVLITGPGSVWSAGGGILVGFNGAGNQLVITNGGELISDGASVGRDRGSSNNMVLVSGSGSVWSNRGSNFTVGEDGSGNQLIITDGGKVYSGFHATSTVGSTGSNNTVLVSGPGSTWYSGFRLLVGNGSIGNQVIIGAGGSVVVSMGYAVVRSENQIAVSGGTLYVTNSFGNGVLNLAGTLLLNDGTVTVDGLSVSGPAGGVTFYGGVLNTKATTVDNGSAFTVGNGTTFATLNLDSGGSGFHSFANGLTISSNATLKGNGTVIGAVTFNAGGVLSPGASPGSITFSNSLTLAPQAMFAVELNGSAAGLYDQIVALDTISVSNSVLKVSLNYAPSVGDTFTIVSNLGPSVVFGQFVDAQGNPLANDATFLVDGTTFRIDYNSDANSQDVVLTAVSVPEPTTVLLVAFGTAGIVGIRRRRAGLSTNPSSVTNAG